MCASQVPHNLFNCRCSQVFLSTVVHPLCDVFLDFNSFICFAPYIVYVFWKWSALRGTFVKLHRCRGISENASEYRNACCGECCSAWVCRHPAIFPRTWITDLLAVETVTNLFFSKRLKKELPNVANFKRLHNEDYWQAANQWVYFES